VTDSSRAGWHNRAMTELAPDQPTTPESAPSLKVARRAPLISAIVAILLAVALGVVIVLRDAGNPFGFDTEWMEEIVEHRAPYWEVPSLLMNFLGGGIFATFVLPILTIVGLLVFRRRWAALYYLIAVILSAGIVQLLKNIIGRPRPEDMIITSDFGSFPSGHSANAATMAVTLAIIFARTWIWIAGVIYTALMMLSRTYLGAHWISDTVAGLLIGVGVAIIIWAPLAYRLHLENDADHSPVWRRRLT